MTITRRNVTITIRSKPIEQVLAFSDVVENILESDCVYTGRCYRTIQIESTKRSRPVTVHPHVGGHSVIIFENLTSLIHNRLDLADKPEFIRSKAAMLSKHKHPPFRINAETAVGFIKMHAARSSR